MSVTNNARLVCFSMATILTAAGLVATGCRTDATGNAHPAAPTAAAAVVDPETFSRWPRVPDTPIFMDAPQWALAGSTLAALQAVPIRVEETRAVTLVKDNVGRPKDALAVKLSLNGREADAAYRYGPVTFEEAVDDQGTNLVPEVQPYEPILRAFENETFRTAAVERKQRPDNPWASLNLAPAKRSATKISRLRGSFNVYSRGTPRYAEAMHLVTDGTAKLTLPKAVGLTITLTVRPDKDLLSIEVKLDGDVTALEALEVFDSGDKPVPAYLFLTRSKGQAQTGSLKLSQPLTNEMRIPATIATGRTVTPVRFDIKDVPLP